VAAPINRTVRLHGSQSLSGDALSAQGYETFDKASLSAPRGHLRDARYPAGDAPGCGSVSGAGQAWHRSGRRGVLLLGEPGRDCCP
jgi:hypothetical protein